MKAPIICLRNYGFTFFLVDYKPNNSLTFDDIHFSSTFWMSSFSTFMQRIIFMNSYDNFSILILQAFCQSVCSAQSLSQSTFFLYFYINSCNFEAIFCSLDLQIILVLINFIFIIILFLLQLFFSLIIMLRYHCHKQPSFYQLMYFKQKQIKFLSFTHYFIMKKSVPLNKIQETAKIFSKSNNKNPLAQRLFDTPAFRGNSQKRPRVFSNNETNINKLTPTIVREYQLKKQEKIQSLPPIDNNPRLTKLMTQQSEVEYIQNERIANIKKSWMDQYDSKNSINQIKAKQSFNKTRVIQSRMNRTLTESRHVIHLIDKMKGQFAIDKNKLNKTENQYELRYQQKPKLRQQQYQKISKRQQGKLKDRKQLQRSKNGMLNLQNSKEIDLFIFMAQDGKIPDYQFYYMIKEESNDYYNMDIVTYQTILKKKMTQYYTLSGHGVTKYEDSRPVEFISLSNWDAQRRQFNQLKQLQFFKKFRKWKTLKKWINILSKQKLNKIRDILSQNLFFLNNEYRGILLVHHNICYDIQQFKCLYVPTQPLNIHNFRKQQEKKKNSLIFSLKQCSKEMHKNSSQGLKSVVEELKNQVMGGEEFDENEEKEGNLDEKIEAFVQLGFSSSISFGHRSTVRSQFMKFLRLAYLLDFVAIDSLGKMVLSSLQNYMKVLYGGRIAQTDLRKTIFEQNQAIYTSLAMPKNLKFGNTSNVQGKNVFIQNNPNYFPILQLFIEYKEKEELTSTTQKVLFSGVMQSFLNFDIEGFLIFQDIEKGFTYEDDSVLKLRKYVNVCSQVLNISPTQEQINHNLIECVTETLDALQIIQRWAKNDQFSQYVRALQEWDDIIGEKWQGSDERYLGIGYWLKQQTNFRGFKSYVKNSVSETILVVMKFIDEHKELLSTFQRNIRSNIEMLADHRMQDQGVAYQIVYDKLVQCQDFMNNYLLEKADIYIYSVQMKELRTILIEKQKNLIKNLCSLYLSLIKLRGKLLKQWLSKSIQELTGLIIRIQDFVIQKQNLDRINIQISKKRQEIGILGRLLHTLQTSKFSSLLTKQDKQILNQLTSLIANLSITLSDVQNQMPKYIERFKKQIRQTLQKFQKESEEMKEILNDDLFNKNNNKISQAAQSLEKYKTKIQNLQQYTKKHRMYEQVLQVTEFTNFKDFRQLKSGFFIKYKTFNGIIDLQTYTKEWNQLKVMSMQVKQLSSVCDRYMKDLAAAERGIPENYALPIFKKKLFIFRDAIPVITAFKCPYLQQQDYKHLQLLLQTNISLKDNEQLSLKQFLSLPFQEVQQQIINISTTSTQCFYLKRQLDNFQNSWVSFQIKLKQFKQTSDIIIIYEVEQLTAKLDESMAIMSNLLSNRYISQLRDRAQKLNNQILIAQQIIQKLVQCQKKWVYLENIFSAQDIKKQLLVQAGYFQQADKFLKNLTKKAFSKPLLTRLIKNINFAQLTKILQLLEQIEKKLEDYLQVKRRLFSRFYFISNDELVQILANSNNINIILKHINKLFQGVATLNIQKQTPGTIDGLVSAEGQIIKITGISTRFNIEMWLNNLQKQMIETMKKIIRDGNKDYLNVVQKTRVQWILNHKSQAVLTDNQIIWTTETQYYIKEQAIRRDSLNYWYQMLVKQLNQLTELIRTQLKPLYHKIAVALITADVHNRDVVLNLINSQVQSIYDFGWQQQLKYYIEDNDTCTVKQVSSSMDYGYEYLGATTRLVITPLTDKCWITISSAIANYLGASPAGPAGTGKTESTKDLAKGLARVCIVFNCSDQITAQMMNKLFSGLAQQGAWACLDQFNRIDIEVLSVIAQQLFSIRVGLKKQKGQIQLQGKVLPIKRNFGVFITMNPGYAGRTQLPDNLKSLFRPVAMMIPDYAMIAEIMLFAQGFTNASELSRKMIQLYKLASQQLSQQKHYDFGLRAVKSLLVMAGQLKRQDTKSSQQVVLIKAMKQSNIPKFLQSDIYLFQALVSDLFPNVIIEETFNEKLKTKTIQVIKEMKLGNQKTVALKVLQLHEVVNIRFGLMIVGEAGVGKTTCYRILQNAMSKVVDEETKQSKKYYKVQYKVVNPKSVSMGQLYGEIDLLSQQWTDGLLSSIMRQCNNDEKKAHFWITLDGPVDAMWIENLNTVLDDNMTLCLANGQRIKLRSELRMLFEVQNLEAASPATVSRCGMVYISSNDNYIAVIQKSVSQLPLQQDLQKHLLNTILTTMSALTSIIKTLNQPIATIKLQIAQCLLLLIKVILNRAKPIQSYEENVKRLNLVSAWSLIWAIGSSIQYQSYNDFEANIRANIHNIFLPKTQTLFDFFVNPETLLSFVGWQSKLQQFQYFKGIQYHNILVPTIDTLKCKYILDILLQARKPILITGNSGVGKTSLVVPYLFSKRQNNVITIFLNFSAKTKSKQTQFAIQSKLNKKGKTLFGARPNETIAIFIDDINMPQLQKEGAQPTIQLLRQFIDYQGFYDRQKLFWKQVVDTTIIGCGATPSGGRNKLNSRFVRHHMVICLPEPSQSNMKKIFGSIMKGFLSVYNFPQQIKKLADGIISCTLDFYKTIRKQILPIPSKFHYLFNLRDISRVFQGMLQCSIDSVTNSEKMLLLWAHELQRVFGDRLNNASDRLWFYQYASTVSKRFTEGVDIQKMKNHYFTKMMTFETGEPIYEEVEDLKKIVEHLENKIFEYNLQSTGKLQLVFFKETVEHILRIYRVLSQPRGNCMLIGVGGSGKQSLSKLSSFIANCKISQLQFGKNYGIESFKTDLQKISLIAGAQETPLCFLFIDTQILHEQFLESINNLLNTGEVPNLFNKKEDIDDILNRIRPSAIKQKKSDSPQSLWSFFIANIRANLHIVLCMSPAGDSLRIRTRKFPSLIDCCTINWFDSWSQQSLYTVAERTLQNMPLSQDQKKKYTQLCTFANLRSKQLAESFLINEKRKVQSTPKTYLDQLALFNKILNLKKQQIQNNKRILTEGLQKLYFTNDIVIKLKIQMTKMQPKLEAQCVKTQQFLLRLGKQRSQANLIEQQVLAQALDANEQTLQIKIIKDQAHHQLSKALPMLLEAEEALKRINKNDITEIKGYSNPHPIVLMVLQAVCILLNEKTDWASIKVVLVDMAFLDRLKNFQKTNIPDQILKKLRNYTTRPEFQPQTVGQKNLASKSLCMWCRAIDNYSKVLKEVEPKKRKLNELQKVFEQKNKILFMKQKQLNKVKQKVSKLQKQCQQTLDLKNKLQEDLELTSKRLQRAQKLTNLLKDESLRWSTLVEGMKSLVIQTPGQSFLASIYLSYLGPFTGEYRQQIYLNLTSRMKESNLQYPQNFSLVNTLFDQITIRDWILEGLPNDPVSVQNAIISKKGIRYPLMIDPQLQANKWLKKNQKTNTLSVVTFNNPHYLKAIQTAVNCGYPILIQDVQQTLQSSIDSLLEKKIQMIEGLKMTVLGDKKIIFDDRFYLYMTTRLGNPKFLAQIFNKSTVINFSITFNGLKDQLLSDVCKKEKPQIETQRDQIIVKVAENKKFLKQSQDKILKLLASSKGMVLDDIELITTLQQSKIKSKEVEKNLQKNSIIQEEINIARSLYLPTAVRGTILYFVISKLCLIQPMYQFSLQYVKKLYNTGIQKAEINAMIELRLRRLNQSITKIMFTSISRSLFEVHKKLYAFLICCAIKRQNKTISDKEWNIFSKGVGIKPKNFKQLMPIHPKITPQNWYYLHKLTQLKGLQNLFTDFRTLIQAYLQFFGNQSIMNGQFPGKQITISNNFYYLLLSKVLSPQNLIFHMSQYVHKQIGKYYDQSHVTSIQQVLSGCVFNVPLLFVLSTGVDPTNSILSYCNKKSIHLQTISLGQGQGKKAQNLIARAQNDGVWVLLNNCHLSKSWLGELENTISLFSDQSIPNKNFRLLLSSMPVDYFPSNILQNADKITMQPPRGIKPNISKSFKQFNQETINSCPNRKKEWLQCLYSLSFFHALLQQRRKYGPLGFNIRYQFNDSDLQISLSTLRNFLNDGRQDINWDAIWYMIGHINYGGRVTDDLDRICLLSTLKKCLNPDLLLINNSTEKFFYSDSEDYYCLNCHTLEDFQMSIDRLLPNIDTPQVFGLHINANLSYIIQQSNNALSCIQMIQPKESGTQSKDDNLLSILSNLQQLPSPIRYSKLPDHLLGDNNKILPSMTNFLLQEVDKFNNFLFIIQNSLKMLENAIKGIVSMNSDLDQMTNALNNNSLPVIWLKYCYETQKPLASWFVDFKLRFQFMQKCFQEPPTSYWISCFFFPQGLLTAFLQTHARKMKIPIDTLSFKFKLTEVEKEKLLMPKEGGYIYGMHFEGAKYDTIKDTLVDQQKGKINQPAPTILLLPVQNYEIGQNYYNCPCYKTSKRSGVLSTTGQSTNFILGIHLNSKIQKPQYWTLKGTALVCQLNY